MDSLPQNGHPVAPEPPPPPVQGHSPRRLVLGAILDLLISLVLTVAMMAPALIWIVGFRGELHKETWAFARLPAADEPLTSWLASQQGIHDVRVVRKDGGFELSYRRTPLAGDVRIPWDRFGYEAARQTSKQMENAIDPKRDLSYFLLPQGLGMLAAAMFRFYRRRLNKEPKIVLFQSLPPGSLKLCLGGGLLILLSGALQGLAIKAVFGEEILDAAPLGDLFKTASGLTLALLGGYAALVAPAVEELLFRGAMFGRFAAAGHPKLGAVVSAALFSVVHGYPPMALHYFLLGLMGAWLFYRTRSLWAPILAHLTLNTIAVAMVIVAKWTGQM